MTIGRNASPPSLPHCLKGIFFLFARKEKKRPAAPFFFPSHKQLYPLETDHFQRVSLGDIASFFFPLLKTGEAMRIFSHGNGRFFFSPFA